MKDNIKIVCEKINEKDISTLREFLNPLDLYFEPEEFIEQDNIEITPKIIAITIYLDLYPETITADTMNDLFKIYVSPYSKITQDEYFMMTEYIYRYY